MLENDEGRKLNFYPSASLKIFYSHTRNVLILKLRIWKIQ